jgi:hypothetical protein
MPCASHCASCGLNSGGDQSGAYLLSNCCLLSVFCTFDRTVSLSMGKSVHGVTGYSDSLRCQ